MNVYSHPLMIERGILGKIDYVKPDPLPISGFEVLIRDGKIEPLVMPSGVGIHAHVQIILIV